MLTKLIQEMITKSTQAGRPIARRLQHGLWITIESQNESHTLIIARDEQYPSEQEWKTVLNHWPYKVDPCEPKKVMQYHRMAFKANIPKDKQIKLI